MAFTAGLTSGLTEPITKALLEDYFYGKLTLEQMVAALGSTLWLDATETYAKSKVAVDLDGSADYFYLDHSSGYAYDLDITDSFSFVFSFNPDAAVEVDVIFSKFSSSAPFIGYFCYISQVNKLRFTMYGATGQIDVDSSITLSNGTWYDCVISYDGSADAGGVTIYINGSDVTNSPITNTLTGNIKNTVNFQISGRDKVTTQCIDGQLDQFILFNKELDETTLSEVSALYNSGDGLHHKDLDGTETFYPNIKAWYDFNVPTNFGRNYAEESHAVQLDGVADYLTLSDTTKLSFGDGVSDQPFSLVGWVNASTVTNFVPISKDNNTLREYVIRFVSGKIHFYLLDTAGGANFIGRLYDTVLSPNTWYHFVCTYDGLGLSSGIKIYLNGARVDDLDYSLGAYSVMDNKAIGFTIGKQGTVGAPSKVDEIAVYSDELTSGEVTTLYNGGTVAPARTLHTDNLVSDWSFNAQNVADIGKDSYGSNDLTPTSIVEADLVGGKDSLDLTEVSITSANAVLGHIEGKAAGYDGVTKWLDRSGNGNDATQGTITAIPTWLENQLNTTEDVISFDGADYMDITLGTSLGATYSISMLVYYQTGVSFGYIIDNAPRAIVDISSIVGANVSYNDGVWRTSGANLVSGQYNTITLVLNEADAKIYFYINGTKTSNDYTNYTKIWTTGEFGKGRSGTSYSGKAGQLLLWNKALTDLEATLIHDYFVEKYGL